MPASRAPHRIAVAERLRRLIVRGTPWLRESLTELDLAERLGVSRTPVREALLLLEREGLVVSELGRGFRVRPASSREAREIYPLIGSLERFAVERAPSPDARTLAELRSIQERLSSPTARARARITLDARFHRTLTRGCDNDRALDILSGLRRQAERFEWIYMSEDATRNRSRREHESLLESLARGDRLRAGRLVERHWIDSIEPLLAAIERRSPETSNP